jgi:hypothetical protein
MVVFSRGLPRGKARKGRIIPGLSPLLDDAHCQFRARKFRSMQIMELRATVTTYFTLSSNIKGWIVIG